MAEMALNDGRKCLLGHDRLSQEAGSTPFATFGADGCPGAAEKIGTGWRPSLRQRENASARPARRSQSERRRTNPDIGFGGGPSPASAVLAFHGRSDRTRHARCHRRHGPAGSHCRRSPTPAGSTELVAWGAAQHGLDEPTHRRVAASGATSVTLASLDLEIASAGTFRPPAGTAVILRQLMGLGALAISAIVPLLAARAILGAIITLFLETATKAKSSPLTVVADGSEHTRPAFAGPSTAPRSFLRRDPAPSIFG
jgi:hypothetical protein